MRRRAILDAARSLFARARFGEIKMSEIAERADLAKGTLFIYFPTKEALFLDLYDEEMDEWIEDLLVRFEGGGKWTPARVARAFARSLSERPVLTRLLPLLDGVLETNVSVERIAELKARLLGRMSRVAAVLEKRLDFLDEGEGGPLLLRIYAFVVGLRQISDPCAAAKVALEDPRLHPLVVDFDRELEDGLTALVLGHGGC